MGSGYSHACKMLQILIVSTALVNAVCLLLLLLLYKRDTILFICWVALVVKNLLANAGDVRDRGLIPGSRRSPGGGHGNPLQ